MRGSAVHVVRLHLVLLPIRLAEIALDDRWKDPDWDAAGSAVLLLSEIAPGPVPSHPWRMLARLAAAGATGSLVTRAGTRRRSGR